MGILRRPRDVNNIGFLIFGCAVTAFYFMVFANVNLNREKYSSNGNSTDAHEYQDICSDWKIALDQEKTRRIEEMLTKKEVGLALGYEISGDISEELNSYFRCDNTYKDTMVSQRGSYYVIYNLVKAEKIFGCTESVTLSAPGDYRFLDNIIPLVDRWRGPISIALYAPGYDFYTTLNSIAYLRNCKPAIIRHLVSFHLVFEQKHTPKIKDPRGSLLSSYEDSYDCSLPPPWQATNDKDMYKTQHGLLYPINVLRNAAKLASQTYFIFPNDIELYPTRKFIPLFMNFAKDNIDLFKKGQRNVFVLPIFEILSNQTIPETKTQLQEMLKMKTAIIFHQKMCLVCHKVINSENWVKAEETEGLDVFSVGQRVGRQMVWEPFFVCTQNEPLWDERMTWEGQNNKMVQAYTMCVMKYNFHVMDNAFLIHKPGVKKKKVQLEKFQSVVRESTQTIKEIAIELQNLYGFNPNCTTTYRSEKKKRDFAPKPTFAKRTKST
ncbi:beta-1,4-glucuronyltransferase 1-like [Euwallacea similis]|uniref:beta-1,4-glucuronyltransferase 1-like n=1 Tax=Euwallacea similis TaxID=1736056 RepID=UPI003450901D